MIDMADLSDIDVTALMAEDFHHRQGLPGKFNHGHFSRVWQTLIASGHGFIIHRVSNGEIVEAIGVILSNDLYTGEKTASTAFWFYDMDRDVKGLEGGMAMKAVEKELKQRHVHAAMLGFPEGTSGACSGDMWERDGFRKFETIYRKEI